MVSKGNFVLLIQSFSSITLWQSYFLSIFLCFRKYNLTSKVIDIFKLNQEFKQRCNRANPFKGNRLKEVIYDQITC